jgi:Tol biopolymer transport system component
MKKLNSKGFSVIEGLLKFVIVGIIGFVGWYVYQRSNQASVTNPSQKAVSKFYYTDGNKVISYNPVSGEQITTTLPLTDERFITSWSAGTNMTVQTANDGKDIFYSSAKPKQNATDTSLGEPERESSIISVYKNGAETQLVDIAADDGQNIIDWAVSKDGSKLYYIIQKSNKGNLDLHAVTVSNKQDKLVKSDISEPGTINNPLFLTNDGTLLVYSADSYTLTEHKVTQGLEYSSKALGKPCECSLDYPQAISPDGKKILLEDSTSGETPADFTNHVFETALNKKTILSGPKTNVQWATSIWAPNNTSVLYSTAPFGDTPDSFKGKISVIGIKDKKEKNIVTAKDSKDTLQAVSWSPDGRYIVFHKMIKLKSIA